MYISGYKVLLFLFLFLHSIIHNFCIDKKEEEIKDLKVERLKDKKKNYDTSYIITLLGDAKVGKTCFLKRAYEGTFSDEYTQTYFKRFMIRAKINDKEIVLLSFYDKCGDDMEIYKEGFIV
jgi:GTPase SAR1 family protein